MDSKHPVGDYEAVPLVACPHHHPRHERRKPRRRILFVVTVILGALWLDWHIIHYFLHRRPAPPFVGYWSSEGTAGRVSIPPDVLIDHCTDWREDTTDISSAAGFPGRLSHASTQFELPMSSDTLFFISRGLAAGAINVHQSGQGDVAKVEIVARYRHFDELEEVQVCAVNRGEGVNGVGIFGPDWAPRHRRVVDLTVSVYLPEGEDGSVLNVKNLETDMPLFAHRVDNLVDGVHFDSISLKTANLPIEVKSLHATKAQSETQNSPIRGSYNVSSSLALLTSNAKIEVTVNLFNDESTNGITDLRMNTANGPIHADLNLASAKETGGSFAVAASTHNSRVDVNFLSAPLDSALSLNAYSSLAPVDVKLHETYQGAFILRTSLSRSRVVWSGEASDPAGKGRKREVAIRVTGSSASGTATWAEDGLKLGTVNLESSLSPVSLSLG